MDEQDFLQAWRSGVVPPADRQAELLAEWGIVQEYPTIRQFLLARVASARGQRLMQLLVRERNGVARGPAVKKLFPKYVNLVMETEQLAVGRVSAIHSSKGVEYSITPGAVPVIRCKYVFDDVAGVPARLEAFFWDDDGYVTHAVRHSDGMPARFFNDIFELNIEYRIDLP